MSGAPFATHLEALFEKCSAQASPILRSICQQAWKRFSSMGLPTKALAGYQYFPLSQLYKRSYALAAPTSVEGELCAKWIYPQCRKGYFTFINGRYAPEISDLSVLPRGVVILPLEEALHKHGTFLQMRFARSLKEEKDPFAIFNMATAQGGLFFYVPQDTVLDVPIQCLHLITDEREALCNPRLHLFLGKRAEATLLYTPICLEEFSHFHNGVIDIALEEGARFSQHTILHSSAEGAFFHALRATLKRDSALRAVSCGAAPQLAKQDLHVSMLGENGSCDLKGIHALSGSQQSHVNVHVDHIAPHCHSNQLFKHLLTGHSRSSFEGKIYVRSKAQKTQAYQLSNNLILSESSISYNKPNLEIFADDVKASHGATVTQLDPLHLHYLRSRGVDLQTAKKLLLSGFVSDLLDELPLEAMRHQVQRMTEEIAR